MKQNSNIITVTQSNNFGGHFSQSQAQQVLDLGPLKIFFVVIFTSAENTKVQL